MKKITLLIGLIILILLSGYVVFTASYASDVSGQPNFTIKSVELYNNSTSYPYIDISIENIGAGGNDTIYVELINASGKTVLGAKINKTLAKDELYSDTYYAFGTGIDNGQEQDIGIMRNKDYTTIGLGTLNKGTYTVIVKTTTSIQKSELIIK